MMKNVLSPGILPTYVKQEVRAPPERGAFFVLVLYGRVGENITLLL